LFVTLSCAITNNLGDPDQVSSGQDPDPLSNDGQDPQLFNKEEFTRRGFVDKIRTANVVALFRVAQLNPKARTN
jgi:hypothetical protein